MHLREHLLVGGFRLVEDLDHFVGAVILQVLHVAVPFVQREVAGDELAHGRDRVVVDLLLDFGDALGLLQRQRRIDGLVEDVFILRTPAGTRGCYRR